MGIDTIDTIVVGIPVIILVMLIFSAPIVIADSTDVFGVGLIITTQYINSTSPEDGTTNIAIDINISATFVKAKDTNTLNISTVLLADSNNNNIVGNVSYDNSTYTVIFDPVSSLSRSTTYTATITGVKDLNGSTYGNYSWSFTTVSAPSPAEEAPAGGGGGIPLAILPSARYLFDKIRAGKTAEMLIKEGIDFTKVAITVKNEVKKVNVKVTKLTEKPADVAAIGGAYSYIQIDKRNVEDKDIDKVVINFEVNKSWLIENNYDKNSVRLNRYTTEWQELATTLAEEKNDTIAYQAISPKLSIFAITAKASKALFDVTVDVITEEVAQGSEVIAEVKLINFGLAGRVDVDVYYSIKDKKGNIIAEKQESVAVETKITFVATLYILEELKPDSYIFYVKAVYRESVWEASESFYVIKKLIEIPTSTVLATAIIILLIFIWILYSELKRTRKLVRKRFLKKVTEEDLIRAGYIKIKKLKGGK